MKLLLISNIFPPGYIGGYELGALEIARALAARGHDVQVLTSDYFLDEANEIDGFEVHRILESVSMAHDLIDTDTQNRLGHYINLRNIRKIGSAYRQFKPDVVLLFNIHGLGSLGILQFLTSVGVPTMLYLMDNVFSGLRPNSSRHKKFQQLFGDPQLNRLSKIIAMSQNVSRSVAATIGADLGPVTYIPGWVNVQSDWPTEVHTHDGGVRFVFSSRVTPHKGTELMLDAAENLVRRGITGFSIDVYGSGWVADFMQKVQTKGLSDYIRYRGSVGKSEMLAGFFHYDALLFPTWEREAFGFVASEAAAAGCLPIMTAGIGASEWFLDNIDCIKISRSAHSLTAAMLQVIYLSGEDLLKMRTAAMHAARRNLSFERWISVIERTCAEVAIAPSEQAGSLSRSVEASLLYLSGMWSDASPH
jgi:glycosyltransferase involved in cell wall biosynthesis